MTPGLPIVRRCSLLVLPILLSSCGGGGGGGSPSASIAFSTTSLSFNAAAPFSVQPPQQTITATVNGSVVGTLYIKIVENNPDVVTASNITASGNSGQGTITPAIPATLHAGTFNASLTVHACLNDPTCASGELNGSPQTISVTYVIGSGVDTNTVTPRVVAANMGGNVILRGSGFTGASAVTFGTTSAVNVTVVSDTEIHASYPPLAVGQYPILINSGNVAYSATLNVNRSPAYTATFIPYPPSILGQVTGLSYDADRSALLVVIGSTLLRYAFDGASWGVPTQVTINGLQQVSVSPDGTKLLALVVASNVETNSMSMLELDPLTLSQTASTLVTQASNGFAFPGNIAGGFTYANDGNAIVWSNVFTGAYAYGTSSRKWTALYRTDGEALAPGSALASGDGSIVLSAGGYRYLASAETPQPLPVMANMGVFLAAANLTGSQFVSLQNVMDQQGQLLGQVPGSPGPMVFNPVGTQLYATQGTDPQPELHTYDLSATPSGGSYPEINTAITLPDNGSTTSAPIHLAITPDGSTVFGAGYTGGIAVQPVP